MPRVTVNRDRPHQGILKKRQRENRMQRIILMAGAIVIIAVIALVGSGYYFTRYRPMHELAFKVNDREFDMAYYASALKYYGTSQEVLQPLEQNELIRQAAEKLDIRISDEEARAGLEEQNMAVNDTTLTFIKAQLLSGKLIEEHFDSQVPTATLQRESMAMYLEGEQQAREIRAKLVAGGDFKELAGQYSLDKTTKEAGGYLDWHPQGTVVSLLGTAVVDEAVFKTEIGAISEPLLDTVKTKNVGYWVMKFLDRQEETAHIMAILSPDAGAAEKALARLKAGEDFSTVAREVSQLPGASNDGGDLGYIKKGDRGGVFDAFAFNTELSAGTIGEIVRDDQVQTTGGAWLIKVLAEEKDKTLSQTDRTTMKYRAYYEWVAALWEDTNNKVEDYLTDEKKQWAQETAQKI